MRRPYSFEFAMDFIGEPESSELLAYIQELEKAQGEWISVGDRLPEPMENHSAVSEYVMWYCEDGKIWLGIIYFSIGPGLATHWQPIPLPPTPPTHKD